MLHVEPNRALLVLLDLQPSLLEWVKPNSSAVLESANRALSFARAVGVPTVAIRTDKTQDAEFTPELEIDGSVTSLTKPHDSAFFATSLDSLIFQLGTLQLLLGGLMASSSITRTATDAHARGLQVTLLDDCIGDTSLRAKLNALKSLQDDFRQEVRSTGDFATGLQAFDVPTLIGH